jgi:hypothetical protein
LSPPSLARRRALRPGLRPASLTRRPPPRHPQRHRRVVGRPRSFGDARFAPWLAALARLTHSSLIFAVFTTFAHFAISDF